MEQQGQWIDAMLYHLQWSDWAIGRLLRERKQRYPKPREPLDPIVRKPPPMRMPRECSP